MIDRRNLLRSGAGLLGVLVSGIQFGGIRTTFGGTVSRFDRQVVLDAARRLAERSYQPRPRPGVMAQLGYDQHRNIRFRPEASLWRDSDSKFQVQMFHPGQYFPEPVTIHTVDDGAVSTLPYEQEQYDFDGPAAGLREHLGDAVDVGHAGLRYHYPLNDRAGMSELVSFLGASYFRALGRDSHYGLSARGIALGTAEEEPEEFPSFVKFWVERPDDGADRCRLHALLDGPSIVGAYTIDLMPGDLTYTDIEATLIPRSDIYSIGIAPLTSMYLFSPLGPPRFDDFRPRVHDSQGLSMWLGNGERIWRPLSNPGGITVNAYAADRLRGFGLSQRYRDFSGYQDLGAHYHRRPGAWISPRPGQGEPDEWGPGAVHLVELPAADETSDNIVAFWRPETPLAAGVESTWRYRISWGDDPEPDMPGARTIDSRSGAGGVPGTESYGDGTKFVVEFSDSTETGPDGNGFNPDDVKANVTVSAGEAANQRAHRNEETGGWRLFFDLLPGDARQVDIRCFLEGPDGALSETWTYLWKA